MKKTISISSRKAKARNLQNKVRDSILKKFPSLKKDEDVKAAIMGESGVDIQLSTKAKQLFPFSIECKNQESLSIWSALNQAEKNCYKDTSSLLVFKRNRSKTYAVLEWEDFLRLLH